MDPDISIALRPIRPQDIPGTRALVFDILKEHGLRPQPDSIEADLEAPDVFYAARGGAFWVLLDGSRIIATIGILPHSGSSVELRKMYLHANYRGRQLGQRLLDHAIEWAQDRGFKQMFLETSTKLTAAIGLYRKYGFTEIDGPTANTRCNLTMVRDL